MRFRKGDVSVSTMVWIGVAVAVLVVIGLGAFGILGDFGGLFGNLIPGFNATKTGVDVDIQYVRYDLLEENAKYYDGVKWVEFKGEKEVTGGKIL